MPNSKYLIWATVLFVSETLFSDRMRAASLTITAQPVQVQLNQSSLVSVSINGLNRSSGLSLGSFDFVVQFDTSAFQLLNTYFGDPLLGDQLDLSHLGSISDVESQTIGVRFFELSLDDSALLNSSQSTSFQLVSFRVRALSSGQFPLTLASLILADASGNSINPQVSSATLSVGEVTPTPEPRTTFVVIMSLFGFVMWKGRERLLERVP